MMWVEILVGLVTLFIFANLYLGASYLLGRLWAWMKHDTKSRAWDEHVAVGTAVLVLITLVLLFASLVGEGMLHTPLFSNNIG